MSTPFQNRLVGTVIIAAAAVIFLPDFLDGKKQAYQADFEDIPTAPELISPPEEKKIPTETLARISNTKTDAKKSLENVFEDQKYNQASNTSKIKQKTSTTNAPVTNTIKVNTLTKEPSFDKKTNKIQTTVTNTAKSKIKNTKQPEIEQWVVQLGSFRHAKNVDVLVDKLTEKGFKVFTKPIKTKNGSLTKVFVGPEEDKRTLERKLNTLKILTGVNGKVSSY